MTDESEQQYPVSEGRCVQRDFGLPQRCFRSSKMLRLSTDNEVKHFYADSWQMSNLTHKLFSMYLFIYSSLHVSSMT